MEHKDHKKIKTDDGWMMVRGKKIRGNPNHPEGFGPIYKEGEKVPPMKKMPPEKKKMPMPVPKKFRQNIINIKNLV